MLIYTLWRKHSTDQITSYNFGFLHHVGISWDNYIQTGDKPLIMYVFFNGGLWLPKFMRCIKYGHVCNLSLQTTPCIYTPLTWRKWPPCHKRYRFLFFFFFFFEKCIFQTTPCMYPPLTWSMWSVCASSGFGRKFVLSDQLMTEGWSLLGMKPPTPCNSADNLKYTCRQSLTVFYNSVKDFQYHT